jgi:adenylyltransferase/sulfurtransferase
MVKDIDAKKLKEWMDSGKDFILIDARDPANYKKDHLPGARSLLLSDIDKYASGILEKNKNIVVYSNDINCPASGLVSNKLDGMGYGPVYNYDPSYGDWVDKGYPLEK